MSGIGARDISRDGGLGNGVHDDGVRGDDRESSVNGRGDDVRGDGGPVIGTRWLRGSSLN